jgi:hypothetical protein
MRFLLAVLLLAAVGSASAADEDRTYAIVSLLGDGLSIVVRETSTGSNIDRNARTFVRLETPALDRAALFAADDAIKRASPGAKSVMLEVHDPAVYAAQSRALDEGGDTRLVLAALGATVAQSKATHLLLFTKQRHEAMLRLRDGSVGNGRLEGLGFYVDRAMRLQNPDTGEYYLGFLSPFAYFRVSLVEVVTGKTLGEESVYASDAHASTSNVHPWDTLTSQQKVSALQSMVRQEAGRIVTTLLQQR